MSNGIPYFPTQLPARTVVGNLSTQAGEAEAIAIATLSSELADASTVTFIQSGTGAVTRTVQSKERDVVSVKDFGATGDGVTDDTAESQAAVDSFGNTAANSAGGIYYPRGTYLQGRITFNGQTGFSLIGAGKFLTTIQAAAAASGLPLLYFDRGAYCSVKSMNFNGISGGAQISSAIEAKMTANAGPTPQGMIYEELYIDGKQAGGFSTGIRFTAAIGQDFNNERSFIKNCDFSSCGTGISVEHLNSLLHQIFGGVIGSCGVGISTANGLGGSFTANGVAFIGNITADFDIGDNSQHTIDIVNCKSEASTGLWLRALVTTGRTNINLVNSTFAGTINNAFIDYRSSGTLRLQGCSAIVTGSTRKISSTHASSVLIIKDNFFDIDSVEYAGTLVWGGNKYAGGIPTLTPTATTSRLINLDEPSYSPVTETGATRTIAVTDSEIIANRAGTITLTLPDATKWNGRKIRVRTIQAQTVVSATSNVVPLIGGAAGTAILAATAGKWADLKSDATAWQIMAGN